MILAQRMPSEDVAEEEAADEVILVVTGGILVVSGPCCEQPCRSSESYGG
jgi:hypothetical protein